MAVTSRSSVARRRLVLPVFAVAAACAVGPYAVANAAPTPPVSPTFDVDAYSQCTAAPAPGPDQDFDAFVSTCCVQNAGVPTPTKFGMGCVAPMNANDVDARPLIVLPMRALPQDKAESDLDGLIDMPIPESMP